MEINNIILKPILTERSLKDANLSWFTFSVNINAKKPEIRKAIEKSFNVNVTKLKTNIIKNKSKKAGRVRKKVFTSAWKKARAKLISGQKIQIFEGLEDGKKT